MDSLIRPIWLFLLVWATITGFAVSQSTEAQDAFHITFGSTDDQQGRHADSASFVVETDSGDIVVAGSGGSFWTDTGDDHQNPLAARINSRGELQWQRIYRDMENQVVVGFASKGEEQFILLQSTKRPPGVLTNDVELRRVDAKGNFSEVLGVLKNVLVLETLPVVDGELVYFLIAARQNPTGKNVRAADSHLYRMDLEGKVTTIDVADGIGDLRFLQHLGGQEFVLSSSRYGDNVFIDGHETIETQTDFIRLNSIGEQELLFTLADKACHQISASRSEIFCAEYRPYRRGLVADAIVAYTLDGHELWRLDLEPKIDFGRMQALDSGELFYSYFQDKNPVIIRRSRAGDLVWQQAVHSAGQYTFAFAIKLLKDGRLAVAGTTGPWGGFGSGDTDAMLLVIDASGDDRKMPEIVSTIE